ncbi:hypothetical protein BOX15_Mlig013891g1, partial [Macrostomum lignano]
SVLYLPRMASQRYMYLKDIPARDMYHLQTVVSTSESTDRFGAWLLLANFAGFPTETINRIKAMGSNRVEWTKTFFDNWLQRLPTLASVARAVTKASLVEAVRILEPLCHGEALQILQQWQRMQDEELQLQLPPPSPTMGAPRQQQQQQQQHGEFQQSADSFVVQHRENPHGIEANSAPTATDMETENQPTSCLAELPQTQPAATPAAPVALRQPAPAVRTQLRISWRMGSFNRQPVRQLQLVTNTDEAWAAANRLLSFHRQLAHPHLAPLLGSQKFSGSVDLYFPVYQCTLEDAYCCRIMTKFRCPLDFESRLRLLFGIAKALLYLHGGQQAGQSFVLGNLAANSVMLDSFWCPAICDLTELREADANENFSADVSAFKTVAMETLTGWSSRQDRRKFNEAVNKVDELLTLQPDTRDQLVLDSECLMPDEMRPDETQVDEDDISLMCRLYQNFLILMHKTAGIVSMQDLAEVMRQHQHFNRIWYTF